MSTVLAEHNYRRLLALVPDLGSMTGHRRSDVTDRRALMLRVREQTPYSTLCELAQVSATDAAAVEDPVVLVRVYHDAGVAEVLRYHNRFGDDEAFAGGFPQGADLARKRELNFFLWRWLGHCLAHGHRLHDRLEEVNP